MGILTFWEYKQDTSPPWHLSIQWCIHNPGLVSQMRVIDQWQSDVHIRHWTNIVSPQSDCEVSHILPRLSVTVVTKGWTIVGHLFHFAQWSQLSCPNFFQSHMSYKTSNCTSILWLRRVSIKLMLPVTEVTGDYVTVFILSTKMWTLWLTMPEGSGASLNWYMQENTWTLREGQVIFNMSRGYSVKAFW